MQNESMPERRIERWDRQPGESQKAFEAFKLYRDMDESRSYAKVGQLLGKSTTLVERWGSRYGWRERSRAFDDYMEDVRAALRVRERIRMFEQQLCSARALQIKAMQALDLISPSNLSPTQIARFLETGCKLERDCLERTDGEPPTKIEVFIGEENS